MNKKKVKEHAYFMSEGYKVIKSKKIKIWIEILKDAIDFYRVMQDVVKIVDSTLKDKQAYEETIKEMERTEEHIKGLYRVIVNETLVNKDIDDELFADIVYSLKYYVNNILSKK